MESVRKFTIAARRANSSILEPYEPDTAEYTYVASAINLALSMLANDRSRDLLVTIALMLDARALDPKIFGEDKASAEQHVDWFLNQLQRRFPPVIIDDTITNLDCLGFHPRIPWDGKLEEFMFHMQGVHLNGRRVQAMVNAGQKNSEMAKQNFRDFQFLFSTTIVHEAGPHLLVTWLGRGRPATPKEMAVPGYGSPLFPGESGRFFELNVFGGTTEYYRDSNQDDCQTGVPYQLDIDGWAWRINPDVINKLCMYDITFPFARIGPRVNRLTMHSMGRDPTNSSEVVSRYHTVMAVHGIPDPQLRFLASHSVHLSDLKLIPNNPSTRLIAIA
ncbi:hypothetical protein LOZ12_002862 [Ophidiomyces ophidiicola]|uniref:Uncharacterized protein n=1 Tax=Ophidiomyces ophidiicola TaxID=1387563 RepID=A0ACB8V092_9EURO|nr:hypothetical protein LOZ61_005551 [Ophidiomyces ophidiicola]KAI1919614.1 hypothetical protein LOZ60_006805 [Ophidiomyces ophidiicola]KAI1925260.1 hypothetical protein LOZ64_000522 [Ophidiomyces ophidiicola]KAI1948603.1 hypothetical protein LOZ62_002680 [Ophidiomyces ophidiicola]KAI1958318.1 hypothetical protein LOZ59_003515 [Ophidiomyces ophidiicola]